MTDITDLTESILLDIRDEIRGLRSDVGDLHEEQVRMREEQVRMREEQVQTNERLGRVEFVLEANTAQVTMLSAAVTVGMQSRSRVERDLAALTVRVARLEQS